MSSNSIYKLVEKYSKEPQPWLEFDYKQYINPDYIPDSEEEIREESTACYVHGWFGEKNGMYGKTTSDKQKAAVSKANSIPKPWISENMKKLHEEGNTYTFDKKDSSNGGKSTQLKKPKWYTNGIDNKYIPMDQSIPEGYYRGRTVKWSAWKIKKQRGSIT